MPETTIERTEDLVIDPMILGDPLVSFKRIHLGDGSSLILKVVSRAKGSSLARILRYEEAMA